MIYLTPIQILKLSWAPIYTTAKFGADQGRIRPQVDLTEFQNFLDELDVPIPDFAANFDPVDLDLTRNAPPPVHPSEFYPGDFDTLDEAFEFCQEWAASHGYAFIKGKKRKSASDQQFYIMYIHCDRSGPY